MFPLVTSGSSEGGIHDAGLVGNGPLLELAPFVDEAGGSTETVMMEVPAVLYGFLVFARRTHESLCRTSWGTME